MSHVRHNSWRHLRKCTLSVVSVPICPESWTWACLSLTHPNYSYYSRGLPLHKIGISHKKKFPFTDPIGPSPGLKHLMSGVGMQMTSFRQHFGSQISTSCRVRCVMKVPSLLPLGIMQLCGTARAKSVIPQRREMAPGYTVYFRDDRGDPWGCNRDSYACPPTIPRWN